MPGPLEGLRVLDFCIYVNGPSATGRLSDEGATVVKIEPFDGDGGRYLTPRGSKPHNRHASPLDRLSFGVESFNRGKRGLALDLKHPRAADVMRRLVRWADVLANNFRPGTLEKLGFGYERCREWNPRLIYASNSGNGPVGERANDKSYDASTQAFAGVAATMGGGPSHVPRMLPWNFADEVGAQHFHSSILSALYARGRTGHGQLLETSQTAATLRFQRSELEAAMFAGREADGGRPRGLREDLLPGFQVQRGSDGRWCMTALATPKDFVALTGVIGRPDLAEDPRSKKGSARVKNAKFLRDEIAAEMAKRPVMGAGGWIERFRAANVPVAPVNGYLDVARSEHLRANGYIREMTHPRFGKMLITGAPTVYHGTPVDNASSPHAPRVGEHTDELLAELGYDPAEVAELGRLRAVVQYRPKAAL